MIDQHAVRELELYTDNDGELYRQRTPFLENMKRKIAKGKYVPAKGVKLWEYYVERAARKYAHEFGGTWNKTFPPAVRREVAKHYEVEARRELRGR